MTKLKITVVKKFRPEDVFGNEMKTPSGKAISACSSFKEGQEFIIEGLDKPDGFCGWAWHDIYMDVSLFVFGGDRNWAESKSYLCCTDGMRPVCFKLERT